MKGERVLQEVRKVVAIIGREASRRLALLFAMQIVGSVLEVLGVGLVLPAMILLVNPASIEKYAAIRWLSALLGHPKPTTLSLALMVVLALGYVVKNAYRAWLLFLQIEFSFAQQALLSRKLYDEYLHKPYTFHLQRNSATLIYNITSGTDLFSLLVLSPSLTLSTELVVIAAMILFLFFVNPTVSLVLLALFGGSSLAFYAVIRRRLVNWGAMRQMHDQLRIQQSQQGLGGIKDVKILGRESFFVAAFSRHAVGRAHFEQRNVFMNQLPPVWLETVGILSLAAMAATLSLQGVQMYQTVPTIALFAAAAFRIMPSMSKILNSAQSLRYASPIIDMLHAELLAVGQEPRLPPGTSRLSAQFGTVNVTDLRYRYDGADADAVEGISLQIKRGDRVGIIGASGSGKTTLIDILLGLLSPTGGAVWIDGQRLSDVREDWQGRIGYIPQNIYLSDQSLRENIAFGVPLDRIDDAAVARAIAFAQLDGVVRAMPDGIDTIIGERGIRISGGERQRVGIARALYHNPEVLVLDEATAALDTVTEAAIMDAVEKLPGDKTLLIVAHRLTTVSGCGVIYRLEQGKVTWSGRPAEMHKLFGGPVDAAEERMAQED